MSRYIRGPTQPLIQAVLRAISPGAKTAKLMSLTSHLRIAEGEERVKFAVTAATGTLFLPDTRAVFFQPPMGYKKRQIDIT